MVVSQFGRTFVKIIYKTSWANVQFFNPIAAFAAVLCFELAKNPEAFPWLYYFFFFVCVVIWAIKNYRSFVILSTVKSFDGHFKASIIFGTEFFTACFCPRVLRPLTSICNSCVVSQVRCLAACTFLVASRFFHEPSKKYGRRDHCFKISGSPIGSLVWLSHSLQGNGCLRESAFYLRQRTSSNMLIVISSKYS